MMLYWWENYQQFEYWAQTPFVLVVVVDITNILSKADTWE